MADDAKPKNFGEFLKGLPPINEHLYQVIKIRITKLLQRKIDESGGDCNKGFCIKCMDKDLQYCDSCIGLLKDLAGDLLLSKDAKNGVDKSVCPDKCPCKQFKFDICDEFDCNRDHFIANRGFDCKGKFWEPTCSFYGEHLELNGVEK